MNRHDPSSHVVGAEVGRRLRDGVPDPQPFPRPRVESLDDARRLVAHLISIGNGAADDDDVAVDHRRRRAVVDMPDIGNRPRVAVGQRDHAVVAERGDRLAGLRVEAEQLVAGVQQHAQLVAVLRVAPERRRAMLESGAGNPAELHGPAVEAPQLLAGLRVERRGVVVGRRDVEHAIDHQRLVLEPVGRRPVLLQRLLAVLPLPGNRQPRTFCGVMSSAGEYLLPPDRRRR